MPRRTRARPVVVKAQPGAHKRRRAASRSVSPTGCCSRAASGSGSRGRAADGRGGQNSSPVSSGPSSARWWHSAGEESRGLIGERAGSRRSPTWTPSSSTGKAGRLVAGFAGTVSGVGRSPTSCIASPIWEASGRRRTDLNPCSLSRTVRRGRRTRGSACRSRHAGSNW
jgi:hypothetical protein